jgi:two-component system invasion response regulator UvrY
MNDPSISVILLSDKAAVRAGYKRFIEIDPLLQVIAEVSTDEEAFTFLDSNPVDVVIMDLSMTGQSGIETLRRLKSRFPRQKIVIFTINENSATTNQVVKLGAVCYLTKNMEPELIAKAVHEVMAGDIPITKPVAEGLKDRNKKQLPHMQLLPREFEIFICLAKSESVKQISEKLQLSEKTTANYQTAIRKKLNVKSSLEMYQYAILHRLLSS